MWIHSPGHQQLHNHIRKVGSIHDVRIPWSRSLCSRREIPPTTSEFSFFELVFDISRFFGSRVCAKDQRRSFIHSAAKIVVFIWNELDPWIRKGGGVTSILILISPALFTFSVFHFYSFSTGFTFFFCFGLDFRCGWQEIL